MAKVIIIGGGAAGMMAAVSASENPDNEVIILERNGELGRKIKLTGGGRCNLTNGRSIDEFFDKIVRNGKFMYSSMYSFSNEDFLSYLDRINLKYKLEKDNDFKIYTENDKAEDFINALNRDLIRRNVSIRYNTRVTDFEIEMFPGEQIKSKKDKIGRVSGVILENGEKIGCDKVIIACGGRSFSNTGSDGNMYKIVQKYGHKVTDIYPALVPLKINESMAMNLQGISMKDVEISCKIKKKKIVKRGDMIFTHFGISGPCVLILSSYINRALDDGDIELEVDFLPDTSKEKLSEIIREYPNRNIITNMKGLLPVSFLKEIGDISGLSETKPNSLTKKKEEEFISMIKNMKLTCTGTMGIEPAIITSGGVSVKDVNSTTMESKKISGMFFAGEILDIDAETGGYNLQIAFSTGYAAGKDMD